MLSNAQNIESEVTNIFRARMSKKNVTNVTTKQPIKRKTEENSMTFADTTQTNDIFSTTSTNKKTTVLKKAKTKKTPSIEKKKVDTHVIATSPTVWPHKYNMAVVKPITYVKVADIKKNETYQRDIDKSRLKKLILSMKLYGYWPQEIIILNMLNEAVDGQHRVDAASKCGIDMVPAVVVDFKDKTSEIRFFADKNNFNTQLKPLDHWSALNEAGHIVANTLYNLESDPTSLLANFISIKGKSSGKKLSLTTTNFIIHSICFGKFIYWRKDHELKLTKCYEDMSYDALKLKLNGFMDVFYRIFGRTRDGNSLAYKQNSMVAFTIFYTTAKKEGFLDNPTKIDAFVNKMRSLPLDINYGKCDQQGKVTILTSHFNKNRKSQISMIYKYK